ncbi:hypothetical protein [Rubinisphaera margarita]|uniref:hypothetical protein n=1 Tax=Rubinisphaera margarita TaxID=2909586 RepID=UPI001EE86C13|nr:hypothetical protein [Rubinisphaera margarita]MCG6155396.1 hypothetical protein [Rubinisphaera margarita]
MSIHDRDLLNLLFLAATAHQKGQQPGRDRFLVLAMHHACQRGDLETANACREIVARTAPHHLLGRHETAAEVARDEGFATLVRQLQRHCSSERAEQLASDLKFNAEEFLNDESSSVRIRAELNQLLRVMQ